MGLKGVTKFRQNVTEILNAFHAFWVKNNLGKNIVMFLLFLVLSTVIWLSRSYNAVIQREIQIPVMITHMPDYVRSAEEIRPIRIGVSGKRFALSNERSNRMSPINLSYLLFAHDEQVEQAEGVLSVSIQSIYDAVIDHLPHSMHIIDFYTDSIRFHYRTLKYLKLPVKANGNFKSNDQYLVDKLVFSPDSLIVLAERVCADTLTALYVDADKYVINSDSSVFRFSLGSMGAVKVPNVPVEMKVLASQYTEKQVTVGIEGINAPRRTYLKAFPYSCNVIFFVRTSQYNLYDADDFRVVIDYKDIDETSDKLRLKVIKSPKDVYNIRLTPESVSYLEEEISL